MVAAEHCARLLQLGTAIVAGGRLLAAMDGQQDALADILAGHRFGQEHQALREQSSPPVQLLRHRVAAADVRCPPQPQNCLGCTNSRAAPTRGVPSPETCLDFSFGG